MIAAALSINSTDKDVLIGELADEALGHVRLGVLGFLVSGTDDPRGCRGDSQTCVNVLSLFSESLCVQHPEFYEKYKESGNSE